MVALLVLNAMLLAEIDRERQLPAIGAAVSAGHWVCDYDAQKMRDLHFFVLLEYIL
jgi:hypothetical protein